MTHADEELTRVKARLAAIVERLPGYMDGSYGNTDDLLASLSIRMTYLLFDVEATRRENAYLREMLGHNDRPPNGEHPVA